MDKEKIIQPLPFPLHIHTTLWNTQLDVYNVHATECMGTFSQDGAIHLYIVHWARLLLFAPPKAESRVRCGRSIWVFHKCVCVCERIAVRFFLVQVFFIPGWWHSGCCFSLQVCMLTCLLSFLDFYHCLFFLSSPSQCRDLIRFSLVMEIWTRFVCDIIGNDRNATGLTVRDLGFDFGIELFKGTKLSEYQILYLCNGCIFVHLSSEVQKQKKLT